MHRLGDLVGAARAWTAKSHATLVRTYCANNCLVSTPIRNATCAVVMPSFGTDRTPEAVCNSRLVQITCCESTAGQLWRTIGVQDPIVRRDTTQRQPDKGSSERAMAK